MRKSFLIVAVVSIALTIALLVAVELPLPVPKGYITYDRAVAILCSGQVKQVGQNHHRQVWLDLKNGTIVNTVEPRIDLVFQDCWSCGSACQGAEFVTE